MYTSYTAVANKPSRRTPQQNNCRTMRRSMFRPLLGPRLQQRLRGLAMGVSGILTLVSLNAGAADTLGGEQARFSLEDIFSLNYASSPLVSRDGDHVVYLRHSMDILKDRRNANLWLVAADGSQHRPLTTGARSVSAPALSPDGGRVAYVDKDDAGSQLFVHWIDSGSTAQLTRGSEAPRNLRWSPDGRWIVFAMRVAEKPPSIGELPTPPKGAEWAEPPTVVDRLVYRNDGAGPRPYAFYQLFMVPADGGPLRQLTDGEYDHDGDIAWSPDSTSIYFSANRGDDRWMNVVNSDLYRLNIQSGELTQLTDRQGPDSSPRPSPDGKSLAYLGWDDNGQPYRVQRLYLMDLASGESRELLPSLDRSIGNPRWGQAGKSLYFQFDDQGSTVLGVTDLNGNLRRLAADLGGMSLGRPYSGAAYALGGDDRYVVTLGSPTRPADLAIGRDGQALKQLTALNDNGLGQRHLASIEERWVTSTAGDEAIQAWVALPPDFDPQQQYPMILEIHGGPHTNYGPRFAAEIQLYAAAGYVVLYVNPRGSTSYGERFANLIQNNYPHEDYDDLMSAVDALLGEGFVDPEQLYVTGGSGGGVLTAWIVGKTDRFRAAVVAKPVINWTSFVLTADNPPYFTRYWFPGMPWEEPEHYWQRSPLSLVGEVSTPTMLLTGEADLRTPISETEQYYQALRLRGVETAMVRMPGAYHSIAKRPSQLMGKVAAVLAWFERFAPTAEEG